MSTEFFASSLLEGPGNATYIQTPRLLVQEADWLIVLVAIFIPLCWVAVGLRFYVRAFMMKALGADDWAMLATTLLFTIYSGVFCRISAILILDAVPLASGQTPISESLPQLVTAATCLYSATMVGFKFSMGFFFLKIFAFRTGYHVVIWSTIIIPSLLGIVNIIYTVISPCQIESLFFVSLRSCEGHPDSQGWLATAEAWTVLNTLSDILYIVFSVITILRLQMPWKNKVNVVALCALGSIACLASIVRLGLLIFSYPVYSVLGEAMMEGIWSVIEPGLGITAASLATLRPLVRAWRGHSSGSDSNETRPAVIPLTQPHTGADKIRVVVNMDSGEGLVPPNEFGDFELKYLERGVGEEPY